MRARFQYQEDEFIVTTEHSASSYGIPVVLINGELQDIFVEYEADGKGE